MGERRRGERGQALVMFAIMATALVGAVALVIDVGQLYMQQRRIQNVADMAALVGAQRRANDLTFDLNKPAAIQDARIYAEKNGVVNSSGAAENWNPAPENGVVAYNPPRVGNHVGDPGYLEVRVARTVPSIFAGVFNGGSVRLEGRAVARGYGGYAEAAVIALREDARAIEAGGNAEIDVIGSIYSRGGVATNSMGGRLDVDGNIYARGSITGTNYEADATWTGSGSVATTGVPDLSDPKWPTPVASSTGPGTVWNSSTQPVWGYAADGTAWKFIPAGTYQEITVAKNDHVMFEEGVYHITGGLAGKNFSILGVACGQQPLNTLVNSNNPPVGAPVSFVLYQGVTFEITSTGVAHFRSAPSIKGTDTSNLIIRSLENRNAVQIVGQGEINLYGTVYAPSGDVTLAGSTGGTIHGQLVAGIIDLLGGAGPAVIYDPAYVPPTRRSWLVE